jgi:Thaumatin family
MPGISRTRRARLGAVIGAALSAGALLSGCGAAGPVAMKTVARVQSARPATASSTAASATAASATANGPRRVTFINRMKQTIWVAASPDASHPMARTGWVLRPGHRVTVIVPNRWNGRFWGRTGCVFHGGRGHCQTGDCAGRLQCQGWGTIPATLAEYDLDAWDNLDFYDVSMVDGSNLPMYIYPTTGHATKKVSVHGCVTAGCTSSVRCPNVLKINYRGKYVACESACAKLGGDQYCCRGKWAPRAKCNPRKWPVDYARVFKRAEPYAYSYVDDDATSVYVCSGRCDYHIVFGLSPGKR